jgi:hypothetical protein
MWPPSTPTIFVPLAPSANHYRFGVRVDVAFVLDQYKVESMPNGRTP